MGKYDPLGRYLEAREDDSWETDFAAIEQVLGFPLPQSAYRYPAWWANEEGGSHSHAMSWQDAGWQTRDVDLRRKTLRFARAARSSRNLHGNDITSGDQTGKLLEQASRMTGVSDYDKLIRMGLTSLIQRQAAIELARMGGTMPDLVVPRRERPSP